jgi:hypothetical protein
MKIPFEAILGLAFAAGWLCCLFSAALWAYFTRGEQMNRYDEPSGLPTYDEPCLLYDKDPPERRQTERVKLRGHKVPTPAQRLARFVAYTTIWVIIILAMVKLLWFAFPSGVMQ